MAVAPAQLAGHTAEQMLRHLHGGGQLLQALVLRHVAGAFGGLRGLGQCFQNFRLGGVQPGHNTAVGFEFGVCYRKNLHCNASIST